MQVNNIYPKCNFAGEIAKSIFSVKKSKVTQDVVKKSKMVKKNGARVYVVDIKMLT